MKNRKIVKKINVTRKLKYKIKLGNAALEMIILETDPDLTINEILYATIRVMTELCSNSNSKRKMTTNGPKKPMWIEKVEKKLEYIQGELSILTELHWSANTRGKHAEN